MHLLDAGELDVAGGSRVEQRGLEAACPPAGDEHVDGLAGQSGGDDVQDDCEGKATLLGCVVWIWIVVYQLVVLYVGSVKSVRV